MEPLCPYFGRCGGCSYQNIDYSEQLDSKKKLLAAAIKHDDIKVFSGKEYNYRNRMDFVFHRKGIGLREKGSYQSVVDIKSCAIADEKINSLASEIRDFFREVDYFDMQKHSGTFRFAVIRAPQNDSSISFVLNSDSSRIAAAIELIKEFANKTTANNVVVSYVPSSTEATVSADYFAVKGTGFLKESYLGKAFFYSAQGFFQNNHEMAEQMISYCKDLLKQQDTSKAHLLDLYGGVGSFGISCAELFSAVSIVESGEDSISAANQNIKENSIKNTKAILLDAMKLKKLELPRPLFVITDPPRTGMHQKTIDQLNILKPKMIIYVSCNAQQLGKELPKLKGYRIKSAALFDLFPQTPHSEAVVELISSS